MEDMIFVSVEFVDDPNVAGMTYWYLCPFKDVCAGDRVNAPLGRHNNLQTGVVRKVQTGDEYSAPFPLYLIKSVKEVIKRHD